MKGEPEARSVTEREIIDMLRSLHPCAIVITPLEKGTYHWIWLESQGEAEDFLTAVKNALETAMIKLFIEFPAGVRAEYP